GSLSKLCQPCEARPRRDRLLYRRRARSFLGSFREQLYGIRQMSVAQAPYLPLRVALGPAELRAHLALLDRTPVHHRQVPSESWQHHRPLKTDRGGAETI